MSRSGRAFAAVLAVAMGAGVVAVWVQLGDGPQDVVAGAPPRARGWQRLPEPPAPARQQPALVMTGDGAFLFGGVRGRGKFEALNSGVFFEAVTGRWDKVAPAPFDPPVYAPASVWTGQEAVVVGVPCEAHRADGVPECSPGGYAAAAYSPASGRWRVAAGPPALAEPLALPPRPEGFMWTGSEAVFGFGGRSFWAYNPSSDAWRPVPSPPLQPDDSCVVGHRLVVLDTRYRRGGEVFEDRYEQDQPGVTVSLPAVDSEAYVQPRVSSFDFDAAGGEWSSPSAPADVDARYGFALACSSQGLLVVAHSDESSMIGFDLSSGHWRDVSPPPVGIGEAPLSVHEVGSELVMWNGVDPHGLAYDFGADVWRPVPPGPDVGSGVAASDSQQVVVYVGAPEVEWGRRPRAFRFRPSASGGEQEFPEPRVPGATAGAG